MFARLRSVCVRGVRLGRSKMRGIAVVRSPRLAGRRSLSVRGPGLRRRLSRRPRLGMQVQTRNFSSDHGEDPGMKGRAERSKVDDFIDRMNRVMRKFPTESIFGIVGLEMSSFWMTYVAVGASDFQFSREFVLAYALSRVIKRFRMPLNLAAAVVLAEALPKLTQVKVSALMGIVNTGKESENVSNRNPSKWESWYNESLRLMDNYGAAYYMGTRFMGLAVIFGLEKMLKLGVKVETILQPLSYFNISPESILSGVDTLSQMAGAVTVATCFSPICLLLLPSVTVRLARLPVFEELRKQGAGPFGGKS